MHEPRAIVPSTPGLIVRRTRAYHGPNPWAFRPVMRLTLELGAWADRVTDEVPAFVERLLALVPSLWDHRCTAGRPGGFVECLQRGTSLAHAVEHLALELQCLCGQEVGFSRTVATSEPGVVDVIYEIDEDAVGREAGRLSVELVQGLLDGGRPPLGEWLANLAWLAGEASVGPSTQALVREARRRGIPVLRLDEAGLVQLGHGCHQQRMRAATTPFTRVIAVGVAGDKALARELLADAGIPVPRGVVVTTLDEAKAGAAQLGFPLVVKPVRGSHGHGITLDVQDLDQLCGAFDLAHSLAKRVLLECPVPGREYRILVVAGEVVAVAERLPAAVLGDGVHTVEQLMESLNADPRRGRGHERLLTQVLADQQTLRLLGDQGMGLDSVPSAGRRVALKVTAHLSMGGASVDCTDDICFENVEMAVRAARVTGLDVAGVDVICSHPGQPLADSGGVVLEVNASPGLRAHLAPTEGRPRDVAAPILDMLFPPGRPSRIPIIAITGTNGKTTTSRMCAHILKMGGHKVGLTTTDGIYVDGTLLRSGDMTGPWSAQMVLRDPTIDVAVLETARGGILRAGLGFDRCDVGAVLNVSDDHLGLEGVDTIEDLARVKSLVAEVVQPAGCRVLNAEDPACVGMAPRSGGRVAWFATDPRAAVLADHVARGGMGATCEGGTLVLVDGCKKVALVGAAEIPATYGGRSGANLKNALAASLICHAAGVPVEDIREGLLTFQASHFLCPGRLNMASVRDFRVLMDYAHNIAAFEEMARLVASLPRARTIGVVAGPGDRQDSVLRRLGEIAGATFDLLVIKEDDDLRGRKPGESAAIIEQGARQARLHAAEAGTIHVVLSEVEAVARGLELARRDDLVVLLADQPTRTWRQVLRFQQRDTGGG